MRQNNDALTLARETRRHAQAFAATVRRFENEMPDHLERFHEAMEAFRMTAHRLHR